MRAGISDAAHGRALPCPVDEASTQGGASMTQFPQHVAPTLDEEATLASIPASFQQMSEIDSGLGASPSQRGDR